MSGFFGHFVFLCKGRKLWIHFLLSFWKKNTAGRELDGREQACKKATLTDFENIQLFVWSLEIPLH